MKLVYVSDDAAVACTFLYEVMDVEDECNPTITQSSISSLMDKEFIVR
jgi:hypothetical protein